MMCMTIQTCIYPSILGDKHLHPRPLLCAIACIYPSILGDKHLTLTIQVRYATCIYPSILGDKHHINNRGHSITKIGVR